MAYPKFEKKLTDQVVNPQIQQGAQPGYGVVLEYDKVANTAIVVLSMPGSDQIGRIYQAVPCPTNMGIQTVAPEPGRQCWVVFKDGTQSSPMITHFFNHTYEDVDYERQYKADSNIPRFMLEM